MKNLGYRRKLRSIFFATGHGYARQNTVRKMGQFRSRLNADCGSFVGLALWETDRKTTNYGVSLSGHISVECVLKQVLGPQKCFSFGVQTARKGTLNKRHVHLPWTYSFHGMSVKILAGDGPNLNLMAGRPLPSSCVLEFSSTGDLFLAKGPHSGRYLTGMFLPATNDVIA